MITSLPAWPSGPPDSDVFQNYKSGVIQPEHGCRPPYTPPDHAVTIVGMTANSWIVKNSWGANWGAKGFLQIARGMGNASHGPPGHNTASWPVQRALLKPLLKMFTGNSTMAHRQAALKVRVRH